MTVDQTNPMPPEADEQTAPTAGQIDLVRRLLAPHIHRARAERSQQQAAA